ncbi:MAG TPA: single-stranded DNA-binding protein [Clostridiales bacterium]|nr:MAG: hypothetical protein A2Y22_01725 [Clostridiales bacterium GWD2_32_59]HAN10409.1 single-stranded DNA-binding protein [Clostridiales bacterium]
MHNNIVKLTGQVISAPIFSHSSYEDNYYIFSLSINRLSQTSDILPIIITSKKLDPASITPESKLSIYGDYRSFNFHSDDTTHLSLNVFAKKIDFCDSKETPDSNEIILNGYLCKAPIFRKTPLNRTVCDILLAVNRPNRKSDYIPCIVWGKNAELCKDLITGTNLNIKGRIQSRSYQKKTETAYSEKTAYEVSVSHIEVLNKNLE